MKILVYKDIESKFLLFLLIERSICNLYLQFGSTLFRVSTFQLGIRRLQVMLNTNYGRSSAVCIVGHNYGDYYYFIPILSFAFAPFCFPCSFIPRCTCRFFGFLFGGLFFIDASRNQTGYILKVYWLVSILL